MMKWYDKLQYGAMLLMAAAVPQGWHYGLWAAGLLACATAVKIVAQRKVGNPVLTAPLRWAMAGAIVYWVMLAVSMLWSHDLATGGEVLLLKAVLLIFPACFLLSDTSFLTQKHISGLGYALLITVCGAFIYFFVRAGIGMLQGVEFETFKNSFYTHESSAIYHHAYIALYAVIAMLFVYHEFSSRWKELKVWHRILLIVSLPVMICYVVFVNSRAGLLSMGLMAVACVVHLTVTRRNWKIGLGIGTSLVVTIVAAMLLMPGYVDRLASTVEHAEDDTRTFITISNIHAFTQSPIVGYGVGDYHAQQIQQYGADDFESGVTYGFNSHNQYMESLVAVGVFGLLALLYFLLAPLSVACCRRSRFLFPLTVVTGIVMFNMLFESMFERQMGLLFIGYLYSVMILILSVEEKIFAQSSKS